ncbi:MOSC domain-containing protein [Celeribacter marinus]|uniref:MOSC domain-containing protein n=1 Tax=Celeribacter marinus TaxID=1397108 RepID=UPI003F6D436E
MKLSRISTYPVKSLPVTDHAARNIGALGVEGDRRWAILYPTGAVATRRELPELARIAVVETDIGILISYDGDHLDVTRPKGQRTTAFVFSNRIEGVEDAGNLAASFLSCALGREVRLAYFPNEPLRPVNTTYSITPHFTGFADGYPILITTNASLEALNTAAAYPFEMRRFRANLVIEGDIAPWVEDTWRRIRIGSTILRIVKPCERCVMTTQDPDTGVQTDRHEPLATLGKLHRSARGRIIFGQNAVVEQTGTVVLGDCVEVLEDGPSNLL